MKREIEEELGVSIIVLDKIFATIHSYFDKTVCLDFYRALPEDMDKFTPEPLDKQEFAWVDRRDLLTYDFAEADRRIIEFLANSIY